MIIQSTDNKKVSMLRRIASSAKARRETGLCFCEGDILFHDALTYGVDIDRVFFREGHEKPLPESIPCDSLSGRLFDSLSLVDSPQSVIFLARIPREKAPQKRPELLLDALQDPGNLGTIIRTAVAFDIPVFLGEGCTDPFSPKAVRSCMGALFRVNLRRGKIEDEIERLKTHHIRVLAATLTANSYQLGKESVRNTSIIIGNEGNGVSPKVVAAAEGEIIIPMTAACESLNASMAAGIFMWEMAITK